MAIANRDDECAGRRISAGGWRFVHVPFRLLARTLRVPGWCRARGRRADLHPGGIHTGSGPVRARPCRERAGAALDDARPDRIETPGIDDPDVCELRAAAGAGLSLDD